MTYAEFKKLHRFDKSQDQSVACDTAFLEGATRAKKLLIRKAKEIGLSDDHVARLHLAFGDEIFESIDETPRLVRLERLEVPRAWLPGNFEQRPNAKSFSNDYVRKTDGKIFVLDVPRIMVDRSLNPDLLFLR